MAVAAEGGICPCVMLDLLGESANTFWEVAVARGLAIALKQARVVGCPLFT